MAIISAEQQCVMKGLSRRGGSGVDVVLISPPTQVVQTTYLESRCLSRLGVVEGEGPGTMNGGWLVSERVVSRKRRRPGLLYFICT